MSKFFFKIWVAGVLVVFTLMAFDISWAIFISEKLYPVNLEFLNDKEKALRIRRGTEEENEEEQDAGNPGGNGLGNPNLPPEPLMTPGGNYLPIPQVNPFIPVSQPVSLPEVPEIDQLAKTDHAVAQEFDQRNLDISAFSSSPAGVTPRELIHCKATIERTLSVLPKNLTKTLDKMTLYFNHREPRGLSNSHTIELRCGGLTDREVVAVLVHELGHITDLGAFRGSSSTPSNFIDGSITISADDPSVQFYGISWQDATTRKFSAKRPDFVSGYAMNDPFEDFAESFIAYVLHGNDFRKLAQEDTLLQKKYNFLKEKVFAGAEYEGEQKMKAGKRVWDVTLVDYNLAKFWQKDNRKLAASD